MWKRGLNAYFPYVYMSVVSKSAEKLARAPCTSRLDAIWENSHYLSHIDTKIIEE